jgi:hypothetical protein
MKRKFEQWWSTIRPIPTKQTTTSHLKQLPLTSNHVQHNKRPRHMALYPHTKCGGVRMFNWIQTLSFWILIIRSTTTIQYNTIQIFLFPTEEPFRAEQLTTNLIQWLWIDYIDWKMTQFYETITNQNLIIPLT